MGSQADWLAQVVIGCYVGDLGLAVYPLSNPTSDILECGSFRTVNIKRIDSSPWVGGDVDCHIVGVDDFG